MKIKLFITIVLYFVCCSSFYAQYLKELKKDFIVVKGQLDNIKPGDSLLVIQNLFEYGFAPARIDKSVIIKGDPFLIKIGPISFPSRLFLRIDTFRNGLRIPIKVSDFYLVEPGDTIEISKFDRDVSFSSPNSAILYQEILENMGSELRAKQWKRPDDIRPTEWDYRHLDSITLIKMSYLEAIKSKISVTSYHVFRLDVLSGNQSQKRSIERRLLSKDNNLNLKNVLYKPDPRFPDRMSIKKSLSNYHDNIEQELQKECSKFPQYLTYSSLYPGLVKMTYERDSCIIPNIPFDPRKFYFYLNDNFKGLIREKLILNALYSNVHDFGNRGIYVQNALSFFKNKDFRNYLIRLNTGLKGDPAYPFALPDLKGNKLIMDSLKGKVVVMDFWFTGCPGCIEIHPKFDKVIDFFSNNPNVIFLSVNVSKTYSSWKKGITQGKYTSLSKPNLFNIYTDEQGTDHPMIKYYNIRSYPAIIIIDANGNIEDTPTKLWSEDSILINKIKLLLKKENEE